MSATMRPHFRFEDLEIWQLAKPWLSVCIS